MFKTRFTRILVSLVAGALCLIAAWLLVRRGVYGWTLFVSLPLLAGALASWAWRPRTPWHAVQVGLVVGAAGCSSFLLAGMEGVICVVLASPVVIPLTCGGSLLVYFAGTWGSKQPMAMVLLVPVSLAFDVTAKPPVYAVSTSIIVNAPPEKVWRYVTAFPPIRADRDWVLQTGIAYPIGTRIEGSGVAAPRYCDLSTGTVRERVVAWKPPYFLRFTVTSTPPAMVETGLWGPIHPKHLEGYYIGKAGQFALTPLAGGRTLVVGTSWYQHGLWPAEYWRFWTDTVIHHIHERVLEHIRVLSESEGR